MYLEPDFSMRSLGAVLLTLWLSSSGTLLAQEGDAHVSDILASREVLQQRLADLEAAARSRAYSAQLRDRARQAAEGFRERLRDGDFRVGDRVLLRVEGQTELSDTFLIARDRVLQLPVVGTISMRGVLRSEIESHLTEQLARFLREPVVQARSLVRISVLGAVNSPGFHMFPPDAALTEAIMSVGGPGPQANMAEMRISRGSQVLWEGADLREAVRAGLTLDELDLHAGDEVYVPARRPFNLAEITAAATVVSGLLFTLTAVF